MAFLLSPDEHQPVWSGVPAAYPGGSQARLWQLTPQAQRSTRETRQHTLFDLIGQYLQPAVPLPAGHDVGLFVPAYRVANLTGAAVVPRLQTTGQGGSRGTGRGGGRGGGRGQAIGISLMLNGPNTCYAAASITFVTALQVNNWPLTIHLPS